MRIISLVSNDLSGDQRVHRTSLTLAEEGYDVLLAGKKRKTSAPLNARRYNTKRIKLLVNKGPVFYAMLNIRYFFLLLSHHFDIIIANDLDTLPAGYLAAKLKRKHILFDAHEYFTNVPELNNRPLVQKIWKKIEHGILPHIKSMITVSPSITELYKKKYPVYVTTVRNLPFQKPLIPEYALKETRKKMHLRPSDYVIIYQGAVNIGRGLEKTIAAMDFLPDNAKLLIVGDGDIMPELQRQVDQAGLQEKVIFPGRVPFDSLHKITSLADAGISLEEDSNLNYRYALPNKLFDYIQADIPVIISPLPEMQKILNTYNIGLPDYSSTPEELAHNLKIVLFNHNKRMEWHKNLKNAKKILTWEHEKKHFLHAIHLLLK